MVRGQAASAGRHARPSRARDRRDVRAPPRTIRHVLFRQDCPPVGCGQVQVGRRGLDGGVLVVGFVVILLTVDHLRKVPS